MRKVIIVDNSPMSYLLQPENAIPISSWFDAPTDQQLPLLLPWLNKLATQDDVLPVLADLRNALMECNGNLQGSPNVSFHSSSNGAVNHSQGTPLNYSQGTPNSTYRFDI